MHIDARQLENNAEITGDICIIGAGVAGITIALEWTDTPYKVILLEGGGFEYDQKIQKLYEGKTSGEKYYNLPATRLHYFGGTSGHWGGYCSPLDEVDFVKRDWVPNSGWPIERKNLVPFYERTRKILDLDADDFSLKYWQKKDKSRVDLNLDKNVIHDKMWQFSKPTRFGKKYKESIVNAKNIHLYTYANVTEVVTDSNGKNVIGVTAKNHEQKKINIKAKKYILATGAIQNVRLLLNSNKQSKSGLGNDYDNVGRYFMDHIELNTSELWLKHINSMNLYLFKGCDKTRARAELAMSKSAQEKYKVLNGTASIIKLNKANHLVQFRDKFTHNLPSERKTREISLYERVKRKVNKISDASIKHIFNAYMLYTRIEQAPNPSSRITLIDEKDALGMHKINFNWEISSLEKDSVKTMHKIIGEQVGISDIGRLKFLDFMYALDDSKSWFDYVTPGLHHMGGTRMSDDPKKGVVNSNCKVHGINNLFIASSSCFATSGTANPTFTIVNLSLRLSDYIKTNI